MGQQSEPLELNHLEKDVELNTNNQISVPRAGSNTSNYFSFLGRVLLSLAIGLLIWFSQQGSDESAQELMPIEASLKEDKSASMSDVPFSNESLVPLSNGDLIRSQPTPIQTESTVKRVPVPAVSHRIVISSLPLGALVFIDGKAVGRTLIHNLSLKEGRHHIELHFGNLQIERTVDVNEDIRFVWRPNAAEGMEEWSSFSP